jgi:hypothetical protein
MGFAETLDSIIATDNGYSREAYAFFGTQLIISQKRQEKPIKCMAITPVSEYPEQEDESSFVKRWRPNV